VARKWTVKERDRFRRLYQAGLPLHVIADKLGRENHEVKLLRIAEGLPSRRPEGVSNGWTPELVAQARALWHEGWSRAEVAKRIGKTTTAVTRYAADHRWARSGEAAVALAALRRDTKADWRQVDDMLYAVSTAGVVASLHPGYLGVPVVPLADRSRRQIQLRQGDRCKTMHLHGIVCRAFHGKPPRPYTHIGFLDGDRLNCAASNLRWKV
jgi:hypothetical protein